jgi:tellurite methyltransferase
VESIDRWNARYRAGELGPPSPSLLLVEASSSLPPGRALDLACGSGRNAGFLAQRGWSVVAIDGSPVAIDMVRSLDPRIDAYVLDLERDSIDLADESFDLVCVINFLHRPLFVEARRLTRPDGLVVSAIHTVRSSMNPKYAIAMGELRSYFADWKILIDREGEIAEIAARKPLSSS